MSKGIALIGYGYWGPNYLRNLKELNLSIKWICDRDENALRKINSTDIPKTTDFRHVLSDLNVEAVIVATPASAHYGIVKEALMAGKHVLSEKPLTLSSVESRELVELAEQRGKILMVGHTFLFNDGVRELKRMIDSGELGEVYEIECIRKGHGPIRNDINALWDLAPHDISIIDYLIGKRIKKITAIGSNYLQDRPLEDSVYLDLEFENGTHGNVKVNWNYPVKERIVTVIGSKKMVSFNDIDQAQPIKIYERASEPFGKRESESYGAFKMVTTDKGMHIPAFKIRQPLKEEILHFVECVNENKKPFSDGVTGYRIVKVLEAAQQSLKTGSSIVL